MAAFSALVCDAAKTSRWQGAQPLRAAVAARPDLLDAPNPDEAGRTPLHAAARSGCAEAVQLLLDSGSRSLDAPDNDGQTPMHLAAWEGHIKAVGALLRAGSRSLDASDKYGRTPLHCAALCSHVKAVEVLLRAGSQLDTADNRGRTPLHCAAAQGYVGMVQTLLRAGADPTIGITDEQRLQFSPVIQQLLANWS